jgi:hypothetical protein
MTAYGVRVASLRSWRSRNDCMFVPHCPICAAITRRVDISTRRCEGCRSIFSIKIKLTKKSDAKWTLVVVHG